VSAPPVNDLVAWLDEQIRTKVREEIASLEQAKPEWWTLPEAADYLRVSRRTFERLVANGDVRSSVVGGRRIIRREWLDQYARAREEFANRSPNRRARPPYVSPTAPTGGEQHAR
jgi:excisionase family DNA binding protein